MSYLDRLRPNLQLTSPDGDVYNTLWIGNEVDKEKKLGIFEYPNFNGTRVEDLGTKSNRHSFSFFITGSDNDIESDRCYKSFDQRGPWNIIHPALGQISLQPISVKRKLRPIEDGNYTEFIVSWIEPIDPTISDSQTQKGDDINSGVDDSNEATADQFDNNTSIDSAGEKIGIEKAVDGIVSSAKKFLTPIVNGVSELANQYSAIERGINDTLDSIEDNKKALAGQIQQYMQLPALALGEVSLRVTQYKKMVNEILEKLPGDFTLETKNEAVTYETGLSAALCGVSQNIINGDLTTQTEAIEAINALREMLDDITESLDDIQSGFEDHDIDMQYFSQSETYSQLNNLINSVCDYLLNTSLSLKIEKRFILDRNRSPIEITVTEYGTLGENDSNLNFFINTNKLKANDILLLPAGREVVVYV